METTRNMVYVLLVTLGIVQLEIANCAGDLGKTKQQNGTIKSPHYGRENGHTAYCIWNLSPPDDDRKYYLKFTIIDQRLGQNEEKKCTGFYNLTLDGTDISCKYFIHKKTAPSCTVFYDPRICQEPRNENTCTTQSNDRVTSVNRKETSFPVTVTYASDGTNIPHPILGFTANYEFKECNKVSTTTTATATTTSQTIRPQSTTTKTTSANEFPSRKTKHATPITITTTTHASKPKARKPNAGDDEAIDPKASTTMKPSTTSTVNFPVSAIIGASVGGGALILILVIVLVVCLYKRKGKKELPPNNKTTTERGENDQSGAADTYETIGGDARANQSGAADTYDTLGEAARENQAEAADTYNTTDLASGSTQPQPDLYATVSKPQPAHLTEVPMHSTTAGATETNQSEPDVYSVVSKPKKVRQPAQPPEEGAVYSAVSIQRQGEKKTVRYNKSMV